MSTSSGARTTASSSSGSYWSVEPVFLDYDTSSNHILYNPLQELKDDLADDLLEIRIKIKYSTTIQESESVQLRQKVFERLCDYFYDSDPKDVKDLTDLIDFKEWPLDFGVPDALSINGKQEGPTFLVLLRPKPLRTPEPVLEERRKKLKKVKIDSHSKHSIKALSRIHSIKTKRK